MMATRGQRERKMGSVFNGGRVSAGEDENVLETMAVMAAHSECAKCP